MSETHSGSSGITKASRHLPHLFLPSVPVPCAPVKGHVNHIPMATTPDIEHTYQVDIDGDGIIPAP
jgi:hypothetical protein